LETKRVLRVKTLNGVALLHVSPDLAEVLFEFGHWCWDTREKRENKPRDERDHAMENLGRLLLEEPRWVDPAGYAPLQMKDLDFNNTAESLDLEDMGFTLD
jgi:hypothetical protein